VRARAYLALCAATVAMPAFAQTTETRLSADVSSTLGYSNNPFSSTGSNTGAAFVSVDIRPQLRLLRERSSLTISADANVQQYVNRYNRSDNYSGGAVYSITPSEHISASLSAGIQSSLIGSTNAPYNQFAIVTPIDPTAPATPGSGLGTGTIVVDPILTTPINNGTDIGLFGTGARRRTINGGGNVSAVLSARDVVNASAFIINSHYSNGANTNNIGGLLGNLDNYTGYGGTVGYSRQFTANIQAGLQGSASKYNYDTEGGDTSVYSVQATTTARINAYWTLNAALGVSFINRQIGNSDPALSGSLALCRRGVRSAYCLNANRSVQPTGILGTQVSTTVGGNYSYRLTERSNIGASADFSRNTTPPGLNDPINRLGIGDEYGRATINYDRQLRQRLRFIASANYRQIFGGNLNRPSDFGGQVGLALRLGDYR